MGHFLAPMGRDPFGSLAYEFDQPLDCEPPLISFAEFATLRAVAKTNRNTCELQHIAQRCFVTFGETPLGGRASVG
jgi:hypothetical protein